MAHAAPVDGVIDGDLWLVGHGDPELGPASLDGLADADRRRRRHADRGIRDRRHRAVRARLVGAGMEGRLPRRSRSRSRRRSRSAGTSAPTDATSTTPSCAPPPTSPRRSVAVGSTSGEPAAVGRSEGDTGQDRGDRFRPDHRHPPSDGRRLHQLRRGGAGEGPGRRGLGDGLHRGRRRRDRRVHGRSRCPGIPAPRRVGTLVRGPRHGAGHGPAALGGRQAAVGDRSPARAADRRTGNARRAPRPHADPREDRHAHGHLRAVRLGLVPHGRRTGSSSRSCRTA